MAEFDPVSHEQFVKGLHDEQKTRLGQYALFEEVMAWVDRGDCTFEEAIEHYKHDIEVGE